MRHQTECWLRTAGAEFEGNRANGIDAGRQGDMIEEHMLSKTCGPRGEQWGVRKAHGGEMRPTGDRYAVDEVVGGFSATC